MYINSRIGRALFSAGESPARYFFSGLEIGLKRACLVGLLEVWPGIYRELGIPHAQQERKRLIYLHLFDRKSTTIIIVYNDVRHLFSCKHTKHGTAYKYIIFFYSSCRKSTPKSLRGPNSHCPTPLRLSDPFQFVDRRPWTASLEESLREINSVAGRLPS